MKIQSKNHKSKKALVERLKKFIINNEAEAYGQDAERFAKHLISLLNKRDDTKFVEDLLLLVMKDVNRKQSAFASSEEYIDLRLGFGIRNYYTSEENKYDTVNFFEKMLFLVNGEKVSLFDLLNINDNKIMNIFEKSLESDSILIQNGTNHFMVKALYSHFINKRDYESAKKILKLLQKRKGSNSFTVESIFSSDYIPVLELYTLSYDIDIEYTVESYMQNIQVDADFDKEKHKEIYKKYKKLIRKIDFSSFINIRSEKISSEEISINYFDLLDSDTNTRESVFKLSNFESRKILRDIMTRDSEKTMELITDFLNSHYSNGKNKKGFIRNYKSLKSFCENYNKEIDILSLHPKLQSYVLLDIL